MYDQGQAREARARDALEVVQARASRQALMDVMGPAFGLRWRTPPARAGAPSSGPRGLTPDNGLFEAIDGLNLGGNAPIRTRAA